MSAYPPIKYCPIHQDKILSDVCTAEKCDSRLLCYLCRLQHNQSHFQEIMPIIQIFHNDLARNIETNNIKYIKLREDMENFFFKTQQTVTTKIVESKNIMISGLQTVANTGQYDTIRHVYKSSFQEVLKDHDEKSLEPLKKHIHSYVELLKTTRIMSDLEKSVTIALEKIKESYLSFEDRLQTVNSLMELRSGSELPTDFDIGDLELGKTVVTEGRIFPQGIEYLSDYDLVFTGDSRGNLACWGPENFKQFFCTKIHDNIINNIKYDSRARIVITASKDTFIKIFKILPGILLSDSDASKSIRLIKTISSHVDAVRSILILSNKGLFLTGGNDPDIRIFSTVNFKAQGKIKTNGQGDIGYQMAYIERKNLVVAGFKSGKISFFHLYKKTELVSVDTGSVGWYIDSILYLKKEDSIIAPTGAKMIKKWKFANKSYESKEYVVPKGVECMINVSGDNRILLGNMSSKLQCLNLDDGNIKESVETGLIKGVTLLYLSKYEKFVVGDWKSHKMVILKSKNSVY